MNVCKQMRNDNWEVGIYVTVLDLNSSDKRFNNDVLYVIGVCLPLVTFKWITGPARGTVKILNINNRKWAKVDKSFVKDFEDSTTQRNV